MVVFFLTAEHRPLTPYQSQLLVALTGPNNKSTGVQRCLWRRRSALSPSSPRSSPRTFLVLSIPVARCQAALRKPCHGRIFLVLERSRPELHARAALVATPAQGHAALSDLLPVLRIPIVDL